MREGDHCYQLCVCINHYCCDTRGGIPVYAYIDIWMLTRSSIKDNVSKTF